MRLRRLALLLLLLAASCTRDPVEEICPTVAPGDLVITEIRGAQTGVDTFGEWVELYNARGNTVYLRGLELVINHPTEGPASALVRDDLALPAGGRVVLGRVVPPLPTHVDYGFADDVDRGFPSSGGLELRACDVAIDAVLYDSLPELGTLSLDGDLTPDAAANDASASWCVDSTPGGLAPGEAGVKGTPKEGNRPCP